jgi:muramoyltetrapeptide carboxypeptidase
MNGGTLPSSITLRNKTLGNKQPWRPWHPLRKGDLVDLIAPGFRTSYDEVDAAVKMLEGWGLRVRVPGSLFGPDVVCSHSDEMRWQHLKSALLAQDSSAIWCLRGGYGAIRLLPFLSKMKQPGLPKLFIGYSDVTTLHTFLMQKWKWAVLHGPLVNSAATQRCSPGSLVALRKVIFGKNSLVIFKGLKLLNDMVIPSNSSDIKGPVCGGNLVVVQSGIGTPYQLSAKGKILFFEDIGERAYRVDRVLVHMEQAGLFKGCRAVIFGDFIGGKEPNGNSKVPAVLKRFAEHQKFPVLKGLPVGHGLRQWPLPMGTSACLSLKDRSLAVECGWEHRRDRLTKIESPRLSHQG